MGLNAKQQRFCEEYLVDLNAKQSAIRAGYSPKTAYSIGHENLNKPDLAQYIKVLKDERAARTQITADRVLEELAIVAFSDVTAFRVDEGGDVTLTPGTSRNAVRALSTVKHKTKTYLQKDEPVTEHDVEVKLWNKMAALEQLGRHLGIFEPEAKKEDDPLDNLLRAFGSRSDQYNPPPVA